MMIRNANSEGEKADGRRTKSINDPMTQSLNRPINQSRNRSMFFRVWLRSLAVKRPQSALAFIALAIGATVASLILNLYGDARRKMQGEFRAYGPNVVVSAAASTPPAGSTAETLPEGTPGTVTGISQGLPLLTGELMDAARVGDLQKVLPADSKTVPVLYSVVWARPGKLSSSSAGGSSLVAVGADFEALRALNPTWKLGPSSDPFGPGSCVLGAHAAQRLQLRPGDTLEFGALDSGAAGGSDRNGAPAAAESAGANERATACSIAGVVSSGAAEDDQAFVPLDVLQQVTGLAGTVSLVEMRIAGEPSEITAAAGALRSAFPGLDVRPVREIVQGEGRVLGVIKGLMLALAALIVGVVALCVMATVTTIVLERRKDVAVMKALGASDGKVLALLMVEIGALGIAGGIVGFAAGALLSRRVGVDLFGVALNTDWRTLPTVLVAALLAAALPALLPVSTVRRIDPARALRGE
jgi:putative ABC transport system permease protein